MYHRQIKSGTCGMSETNLPLKLRNAFKNNKFSQYKICQIMSLKFKCTYLKLVKILKDSTGFYQALNCDLF